MTQIFLSWFKGISEPDVLGLIKKSRIVSGIELCHIDNEVFRIHSAGLGISLHQPFIKGQHWETNPANPRILAPYKNQALIEALKLVEFDFISYHFGYSCLEMKKMSSAPNIGLSPVFSRNETMQRIGDNLLKIQQLSGKKVLVENADYGATGAHEYVCDPEFIGDFIKEYKEHGAGFLLDISHAEISATEFGIHPEVYICQICKTADRAIKEIHVNSPKRTKTRVIDTHDEADEKTLGLLSTALQTITPELIVLERYNPGVSAQEFAENLVREARKIRRVLDKNL